MINAVVFFLIGIVLAVLGHKLLVLVAPATVGIEAAIAFTFMAAGVFFLCAFNEFEKGRFK